MKRYITLLLLSLSCTPAPNYGPAPQSPAVRIPPEYRIQNYAGGSCVHASWAMLLSWQGHHTAAEHWRKTYWGGETYWSFQNKLDKEHIPYRSTYNKHDVTFLTWAISTRSGCMVTCYGGRHMILLIDLTDTTATLLDNNNPSTPYTISRSAFLKDWYNSSSWAATPLYTPPPPLPYTKQDYVPHTLPPR